MAALALPTVSRHRTRDHSGAAAIGIASGGTGCELTPEQITLVLDTTSAHTFNFILVNVGTGVHTVTVQARVNSDSTNVTNGGVAVSNAMYGLGSLTVDSVRLVNSFSF